MILIGIDCGTQSLKVLAWDAEDGKSWTASQPYGLISGLPPGHKEQHPQTWIDALCGCVEELRRQGAELDAVRAIGVSGQQHGLVALDADDQVIRPAKLWCDTSTEAQCQAILSAAGGFEAYWRETGNALPPGFTASKIRWMRENEPGNHRRIRHLLLPHDYLNLFLSGEKTAEAGDASGTGYFQVRQRAWSERALAWIDPDFDLSNCLPGLIDSSQAAGKLRPELAQKWGMRRDVLISSGGGDNMMGAIGSGNVREGVVTVSLGTSGTLFAYSPQPVADPQGDIAAFCDSTGGWLPLGCTMNVTVATEMVRQGFCQAGLAEFGGMVESVPPGSDGLMLLPYLEGERMPSVPAGTGVLLGLRPQTSSPAHLARAAMEGVTFGLRWGLGKMKELGVQPEEIHLTGGGARSRAWRQIAADIFNLPVRTLESEEGPALGAALQALWCLQGGEISAIAGRHVRLKPDTVEPYPESAAAYQELFGLYERFSASMIDSGVFEKHRRWISRRGAEAQRREK